MTPNGDGLLCYGVHVDGGQDCGDGLKLPTYGDSYGERALRAAMLLKRCDPDSLVSVVVWTDDGEAWISRTSSEAHEADQCVAAVGQRLANDRREFAAKQQGAG